MARRGVVLRQKTEGSCASDCQDVIVWGRYDDCTDTYSRVAMFCKRTYSINVLYYETGSGERE